MAILARNTGLSVAGNVLLQTLAIATVLLVVASLSAQTVDFRTDVFPVFERHNCRACHNASGVASGTRLHLPGDFSSESAIGTFGYSLIKLVNLDKPLESTLLLKPTNRIPHTGGALIARASDDEKVWIQWIRYLADNPEAARRAASPAAAAATREPLRRLTHQQYNNSVRDLLGDKTRPANRFPGEDYVNGYTNQAEAQSITPLLAEAYSNAAERLARGAFRFGGGDLVPCEPVSPEDEPCAQRFVREFGLRAFRRPLSDVETSAFQSLLLSESKKQQNFFAGARLVVETLLQAPDFLFLIERDDDPAHDAYAAAARLSYLLWNSLPDDELFRAAGAGELSSPTEVETQVQRMLQAPAAQEATTEFLAQWLRFDRALGSVKDAVKYKEFTPQVAEAMTEETRRLFAHLVWNDLDFRDFFTARYTFANSFLSALYSLPEPTEPFAKVVYPAGYERAGVLGHGTFLAQTGKPDETSPTERGLFVREHFLCQEVPPPPPGVNATLPPLAIDATPLTTRQVLVQMHTADPTCASCHRLVDPIGFGFEKFDTTGRRRETLSVALRPTVQQRREGKKPQIHELPIDSSGVIAGLADSEFSSPAEAGRILAESRVCQECVAKQYFRYAFGRHETVDDKPTIDSVSKAFRDSGFRFRELIITLATSPAFLRTSQGE